MAFFHYWQEKRTLLGKWLMITTILLLCILQGLTLYEIFHNTKISYEDKINSVLLDKLDELNLTKSPTSPLAILSYYAPEYKLHIRKKSPFIDTIIYHSPQAKEELIICQGDYDIRDTSIWSLDSLSRLMENIFRYQNFIPPYSLTLTDSNGKTLDRYQYGDSPIPLWTVHQEIPLGFLEQHLLTAEFIYPVSYFWEQVWDKVITTLSLFFLLILSSITLFIQLHNEKKSGEYRKKFTHTLVHNLRSPLIFLKQQLESIELMDLSPEEQQKALKKCKEKTVNILKDIEHLLSVSVNAYGLIAHCETFDLNALINKLAKIYRQNQPDKIVNITLEQSLSHPVYADPTLLEGALGNLIGNSIKYSGTKTHILINCREEKKKIVITVTDNGFGVPLEEQAQIFRENYRGRQYMSDRQHKGFGLGLFYVQAVIIAHRGHISVKSDGEHGSIFIIEIPKKTINNEY